MRPQSRLQGEITLADEEKLERLLQCIADFCASLEAEAARLRKNVTKLADYAFGLKDDVLESLSWEKKKGSKLGEFEIAARDNNDPKLWNYAYNMLKTKGANIQNRFTSKSCKYSYWLFNDHPNVIFRKKLQGSGSTG